MASATRTGVLRLLAFMLLLAQAGCVAFGGRLQVNIESEPSNLCFYVVPLIEWQRHGEAAMLNDRLLDKYKYCATPRTVAARDYTYVVVMDCPEGRTWEEIRPTMTGENRFVSSCR